MFGLLENIMTENNDKIEPKITPSDSTVEKNASHREIAEVGLNSEENQSIHRVTQSAHELEMSATNLIVPNSNNESLGLIDEEKGIIHTGAGMLPVIPDESTLSYAEKLKAILPAKTESELDQKKADATLEWMRDKGFDAVKDFEFHPQTTLPTRLDSEENANHSLPAITESQLEIYKVKQGVDGKTFIETGISENVTSNPWNAFKKLSPDQQQQVVIAFQQAQSIAQESIHETADDILRRTIDGYIDTAKFPIDVGVAVCKNLWQIFEFERDLLFDPEQAQEKCSNAGEHIGKALVSGVKLWTGLSAYGTEVRQQNDYQRPFRDLGSALNVWFESLTPGDKMNALAGISAGFGLGALGTQIQQLGKPGALVQFLEEIASTAPKNPESERKVSATITKLLDFVTKKKTLATTEGITDSTDKVEDYILRMAGRNGIHRPDPRPLFLAPGENRLLKPHELEAFGGLQKLEQMTTTELEKLGLKRYEIPRIVLESDSYSMKAKIPGDPYAFFRAYIDNDVLVISDLNKGKMPQGMGSLFLSESLKAHGEFQWKTIKLKNIINEETLQAQDMGVLAEETLLGRMTIKSLQQLKVPVKSLTYEKDALNRLDIIITTGR